MKNHKQLYLLLLVMIFVISIFLIKEIKEAAGITVEKQTTPIISRVNTYIPIFKTDPIYGNPGAAVTVIEFVDFNCKKCVKTHNTIIDFINKNPQKMRLIWKGSPQASLFSPADPLPHQAAYCAGQQNKFWQFSQIALQAKKNTTEAGLKSTAQGLSLDTAKWWQCVKSTDTIHAVASSTLVTKQLGIRSLPVVFINNRWINLDEDIILEDMLKQFVNEKQL